MMNVAVIGVGFMGKNHARVYFYNKDVRLVAAADTNPDNLTTITQQYNAKGYSDYKEMLQQEQIDAVSIAVPTQLHHEVALYALKMKKHVLLEKPIASTEQEAEEIIACAKENGVTLMVGHIVRFNPAVLELKRRLEAGELGEIYKIDVQRIGPFPARITDVGVIIDLSVHDIDIINYLIGKHPHRIYAETQQKLHPHCEDSVTGLLSYQPGILAVLNINYLSPTKTRLLKVFGKKGMFKVNYLNQSLYFYENKSFTREIWDSVSEGDMRKIYIPPKEPLQTEIESFIDCAKNGTEPPVNGEQSLDVLRTAHLLMKSAKEGRIVEDTK